MGVSSDITITVEVVTTVNGSPHRTAETITVTGDLADAELRRTLLYDTSCLLVRASTTIQRPQP